MKRKPIYHLNENVNFQDGIHYNKKLEKAVLGAILIDGSCLGLINAMIEPKHFYVTDHQVIMQACKDLFQQNLPIDLMTVIDNLMRVKGITKMNEGNVAYVVSQVTNGVMSAANAATHAYSVVQMFRARRILQITSSPMDASLDPAEQLNLLEEAINDVKASAAVQTIGLPDAIMRLYDYQNRARERSLLGVQTGFLSMDRFTGGYENGCLYVIAARPSMGKSAFMGRSVLEAAMQGHHVGIVQLEMSIEQSTARLSALYSDVAYSRIITGFKDDDEARDRFYSTMNKMGSLPVYINPQASLNIEAIKSWAHSLKTKGMLDILFVDYLQLIEGGGSQSREQDVSKISRGLKLLARQLNIPVVALSQLSRAVEGRAGGRPRLSDLRESGAIEQDADGVYFIHRPYAMGIEFDENGNSTMNQAELIIGKNRNGSMGVLPLLYDGSKMKFYEQSLYQPATAEAI
jgi:replicative DNA helicase